MIVSDLLLQGVWKCSIMILGDDLRRKLNFHYEQAFYEIS